MNDQYHRPSGKTVHNGSPPMPLTKGMVGEITRAARAYKLRDGIPSQFRRANRQQQQARQACDCGNPDAWWHGDPCGLREFMCAKCWEGRAK